MTDAPRSVVDFARLVWAARGERSRLHRLAVESERVQAEDDARLAAADARIYRCSNCGDWRYDVRGVRVTCSTCGHHRKNLRRTA